MVGRTSLETKPRAKVLESSLARGPLQCQSEHYNSMPHYRMSFANSASEPPANILHMYMYDSNHQLRDNPLPQRLRDIVKRCMLQTNDLAQKLRNLANEHNVEDISLHINCDSNTARAPSDIAALIVKPNGTAKASPRHISA